MKLMESYEVVIAGGGTTGIIAAITAARKDVDTLLVGAKGYLRGNVTTGMTTEGFYDKNYRQVLRKSLNVLYM